MIILIARTYYSRQVILKYLENFYVVKRIVINNILDIVIFHGHKVTLAEPQV